MGESTGRLKDGWRSRPVPADLAERYRAEGWWNDDHARRHGRRRPRGHGRCRVQRALEGPAVAGHVRRRRPGGALVGRVASGPGRRAGRRRRVPAARTGSRPASRSGRPPTSVPSSCPIVHFYGAKEVELHPPHDRARRRRHRRSLRSRRLPGRSTSRCSPTARLRCGSWPARRRRRPAGTARPRSRAARQLIRSPPRRRSIPTRRRSSGSRRARPATPRAWCTRTARSASRPASSTTCSPRAGRRRSPARRSATSSGCSTRSWCPLLRERPVNLIDVWDPGEVLRHDARRGPRRRRRRHVLPHEPARPPRLHRRAPGPDAVRRARRLGGPGRRHGARRPSSASRCSAPTAAPSTRRSPAACSTTPRSSGSPPTAVPLPGVELRLDDDGEILSRGPDCCIGYTDPELTASRVRRRRLVPHRRRRRARRRRLPHHHRPGVRHHHPRRRERQRPGDRGAADRARRRSPRSAWWPHPTSASASTPRRCCACVTGMTAPTLEQVRAHLADAGLARQKWPESLHQVADLPRTPSGKVQKFRLRQQLREGRLLPYS